MTELLTLLAKHDACQEGRDWAKRFKTPTAAWEACNNVEWLLWALDNLGILDDKRARLFACWCIRNTPIPDGRTTWDLLTDERSRTAVEVAERFANGQATAEELDAADAAAWAAAWSAETAACSAEDATRTAARAVAEASTRPAAAAAAAATARAAACSAETAAWTTARSARAAAWSAKVVAADAAAWSAAELFQCDQIRKVWGNPFKKGK